MSVTLMDTAVELLGYTKTMSRRDEDLEQELALCLCQSLLAGEENKRFIVQDMIRRREKYRNGYLFADKYGWSVDRGAKDRREGMERIDCEDALEFRSEASLVAVCAAVRSPEDEALFNVGYDRLVASLSDDETALWTASEERGLSREAGSLPFGKVKRARLRKEMREKMRFELEC